MLVWICGICGTHLVSPNGCAVGTCQMRYPVDPLSNMAPGTAGPSPVGGGLCCLLPPTLMALGFILLGGGVTVNFSFLLLLLLLLLWSLAIWPFCRYSYPELTNTIYIPCKWPFLYSWIFFTEAARVKCLAQGCDSSLPIWESVLQRRRPRLLTIMLHCYLPLPDFKT